MRSPLTSGMAPGLAPAKINLGLRVTGRRTDGYHLLDSAVVFADLGDELTALPSARLTLGVDGPFAPGVPTDESNLVLKAAQLLADTRGVRTGAKLALSKRLPHAAGIGSASSDAAAAIRLLAALWNVKPLTGDEALPIGADLPVCLAAPRGQRVRGIGESLTPLPPLPSCGLIMVNPGAHLATRDVFAGVTPGAGEGLDVPSGWSTATAFAGWVLAQVNDLEAPARALSPEIGHALDALRGHRDVLAATMSGSGATCVGITRDIGTARTVARVLQLGHQGWWVAPAALLT